MMKPVSYRPGGVPPPPTTKKTRIQYDYPMMSVEEILESCNNILRLDMCFCADDFMQPAVEKIQQFYMMMLKYLPINFNPDRPHTAFHSVPGICANPDIFDVTLPKLTLFSVLKRVMLACRVDDFKFAHFTNPKRKTTIRMASAIINFLLFTQTRVNVFDTFKAQSDGMRKEYEMLLCENDEIRMKINQIRTQRAVNEPVINEYTEKREVIQKQLNKTSEEASRVQKLNQQLKTKISEVKANIDHIRVESLAVAKEIDSLRPRIIQSPEKFAGEMSRLKRQNQQLRSGAVQRRSRATELKTHLVKQDHALRSYRARSDSLNMLAAEVAKMSKMEERMLELSDADRQCKDEIARLDAKYQQLKHGLSSKQEKLTKLSMQVQQSQQALDCMHNDIHSEKVEIADHAQSNEDRIGEILLATGQIESEMRDEIVFYEKEEQTMNSYSTSLQRALEQYHSNVATSWQPVENALQAMTDDNAALINTLKHS